MKKVLGLFTAFFLLLVFGCSEYESAVDVSHRGELKVKEINLSDVTNQTVLDKILNPQARGISSANRPIFDSINNFSVDPEFGVYIEQGGYHSYTFKVLRDKPTPNLLENLFIGHVEGDIYESILLQYKITDAEINTIKQGGTVDMSGKITKISLEESDIVEDIVGKHNFLGNCYEIDWVWQPQNLCQAGLHNLSYILANMGGPNQCEYFLDGTFTAHAAGYVMQHSLVPCDIGGGGPGPGIGSVGTSVGSVGGHIVGFTNAVNETRKRQEEFMENLDQDQEDCLNDLSPEDRMELLAFVGEPNEIETSSTCVVDNFSFGEDALATMCEGGSVDYAKKILNEISKPCQKQIIQKVLNTASPFTNLINQTFNTSMVMNLRLFNSENQNAPFLARTQGSISGNPCRATIEFDNDFLEESTNLGIAAATLHELVHAYLIQLYDNGQLASTSADYIPLLNAFLTHLEERTPDTANALDNEMHNVMQHFINKLGQSLYNYATSQNINVTGEECIGMMWGTMAGYSLFTEMLTPEQQEAYYNLSGYEEQGVIPPAKGTVCD